MFRKISENAESDSEGKNSQFCKKISQKPYFLIALKTGDFLDKFGTINYILWRFQNLYRDDLWETVSRTLLFHLVDRPKGHLLRQFSSHPINNHKF